MKSKWYLLAIVLLAVASGCAPSREPYESSDVQVSQAESLRVSIGENGGYIIWLDEFENAGTQVVDAQVFLVVPPEAYKDVLSPQRCFYVDGGYDGGISCSDITYETVCTVAPFVEGLSCPR